MAVVDDIRIFRHRSRRLRALAGMMVLGLVCVFSACSKGSSKCPVDDGDPCTLDECKAGVAVNDYLGDDHPCFVGKLQGACSAGKCAIPCSASSDCNDGLPCTSGVCEGGVCEIQPDDYQTAPEDGNACTEEHCAGGEVVSWSMPEGSTCPGGECVAGVCGSCKVAGDCGSDTECRKWLCDVGKCVAQYGAVLSPVLTGDVIGDCRQLVCDGQGAVVVEPAPDDKPWSHEDCFEWVCVGTTPLRTPKLGEKCLMEGELIGHCSQDGSCVQCVQDLDCGPAYRCENNICLKCGDAAPAGGEVCGGSCGACIGTTCVDDAECAGGHCVATNGVPAKVCCNAPCDGVCQQCNALGTCVVVPQGQQDADTCYFPDMACAGAQCRYKAGHDCVFNTDCVSNVCDSLTKKCK